MGLPFLSSWDQQSGVRMWECSLRDPFDSGPLRVTGVLLPTPNGQAVTLLLRLEPRPVRSLAQKMRPQAPEHGPRGHTRGGHRHASTRIDVRIPLCTAHRHPRAGKRCTWPTRVQTGPDTGVHGRTWRLTCMRAHTRAFLCLLSASTHAPAPTGFCFRAGCKHPGAIPLGRPQEGCGGQYASVGPPGGPHHTRLRESPSTDPLYVARWLNLLCDPKHLPCLSEPPYPVPPHPLQEPLAPPPPLGMCLGTTAGA